MFLFFRCAQKLINQLEHNNNNRLHTNNNIILDSSLPIPCAKILIGTPSPVRKSSPCGPPEGRSSTSKNFSTGGPNHSKASIVASSSANSSKSGKFPEKKTSKTLSNGSTSTKKPTANASKTGNKASTGGARGAPNSLGSKGKANTRRDSNSSMKSSSSVASNMSMKSSRSNYSVKSTSSVKSSKSNKSVASSTSTRSSTSSFSTSSTVTVKSCRSLIPSSLRKETISSSNAQCQKKSKEDTKGGSSKNLKKKFEGKQYQRL